LTRVFILASTEQKRSYSGANGRCGVQSMPVM
jgi:hypothetical protein